MNHILIYRLIHVTEVIWQIFKILFHLQLISSFPFARAYWRLGRLSSIFSFEFCVDFQGKFVLVLLCLLEIQVNFKRFRAATSARRGIVDIRFCSCPESSASLISELSSQSCCEVSQTMFDGLRCL